ncbi:MAG: prepilin-type N-terminal cleavage/methylation domain-containing protein [Patescibacteria group bacterium]
MKRQGFTLIELLTVVAIVIFMPVLALPNFAAGNKDYALQRSSHKLAQDLRKAQEMATASQEFNGKAVPGGYGLYLQNNSNGYVLFADTNSNKMYDGSSEAVESLKAEAGVNIGFLSPLDYLTIIFVPPNPITVITPEASWAVITLNGKKNVRVNKAGLIEIE